MEHEELVKQVLYLLSAVDELTARVAKLESYVAELQGEECIHTHWRLRSPGWTCLDCGKVERDD